MLQGIWPTRCRRSASSRPCSAWSRRWGRSISRPAILGGMIGSALVGTFLGVLLAYGIVGPFSQSRASR
jgi:hypothetical protein